MNNGKLMWSPDYNVNDLESIMFLPPYMSALNIKTNDEHAVGTSELITIN